MSAQVCNPVALREFSSFTRKLHSPRKFQVRRNLFGTVDSGELNRIVDEELMQDAKAKSDKWEFDMVYTHEPYKNSVRFEWTKYTPPVETASTLSATATVPGGGRLLTQAAHVRPSTAQRYTTVEENLLDLKAERENREIVATYPVMPPEVVSSTSIVDNVPTAASAPPPAAVATTAPVVEPPAASKGQPAATSSPKSAAANSNKRKLRQIAITECFAERKRRASGPPAKDAIVGQEAKRFRRQSSVTTTGSGADSD